MAKVSKRYAELRAKIDTTKVYEPAEAFALLKECANAKFDESVEVHVRLRIDARKGDQQVRSTVALPHGTGKDVRVGVITTTQADDAKAAGADLIGGEEIIADITAGKVIGDVDVIVATPEMMPKLAQVARVLGPRGLMPNPKAGTVTQDVAKTVADLKKGQVDFRNDRTGNIHQAIGKASFDAAQLAENYAALLDAIEAARPQNFKGALIAQVSVCTTMSPALITYKK